MMPMRFLTWVIVAALLLPFVAAHETGEAHLELPPGVQQLAVQQSELALNLNFLLAFLAGIIGFLSPCSFAVFPAFFAFLFKERKRAVFMTVAFTLGIMLSFVLLGIVAGFVGSFFNTLKRQFATVSGVLLILFGIMLLLNKGFAFFTFRMDHPKKHHTFFSMSVLGFFFALGWTPCVGPILSGVLVLAANTGTVLSSALMLFAYSVGVAVPLLAVAYLSDRFDFARWFQRGHFQLKLFGKTIHTHVYNIVGGLLLIGVGLVVLIFRGTQRIEQFFVENTPWVMNWLYEFNDRLLASDLTSGFWNLVGLIILAVVLYLVYRALSKKEEPTKKFK